MDIIEELKQQGRSKRWLSKELGVSYGTLMRRIKEGKWRKGEIALAEQLLKQKNG